MICKAHCFREHRHCIAQPRMSEALGNKNDSDIWQCRFLQRTLPTCLSQSLFSTPAIGRTCVSSWIMRRARGAPFHKSGWLAFCIKGLEGCPIPALTSKSTWSVGTYLPGSLPLRVNGFPLHQCPWPRGQLLEPWALLCLGNSATRASVLSPPLPSPSCR